MYNAANQPMLISYPHTGDTGVGNSGTLFGYLYPCGPLMSAEQHDENWTLIRRVVWNYGKEGGLEGRSGSAEPISLAYDAAYRLVGVMDGDQDPTSYMYNQSGYLSLITYPGGQTVSFPLYDGAGRPLKRLDGNGAETDYIYAYDWVTMDHHLPVDPDGLLSQIQYAAQPSQNVSLVHDGYDRLLMRTDGAGSETDAYGDLDEPTSVMTTYAGAAAMTVGYAYWPDGSRNTLTAPTGGSQTFSSTFDRVGRMNGLVSPFSESSSWNYQANGWLIGQTLPNGAFSVFAPNQLGYLTELKNQKSDSSLLSLFGGPSAGTPMHYL